MSKLTKLIAQRDELTKEISRKVMHAPKREVCWLDGIGNLSHKDISEMERSELEELFKKLRATIIDAYDMLSEGADDL